MGGGSGPRGPPSSRRAWLSEPDDPARAPPLDRFAKRLALAVFVTAHAEKTPALRHELLPGARRVTDGMTWDALRVEGRGR